MRKLYRPQKGYAMAIFLMVMMILSSLVVVSFLAVSGDTSGTSSAESASRARAAAQDALSRFYSSLVSDKDFRNTVISSHYDGSFYRTLDEVTDGALSSSSCDTLTGELCYRIRVGLDFFPGPSASAQEVAQKMAAYDFDHPSAPLFQPLAIVVRADVRSSECTETSPGSCDIMGSYTQKILSDQFYNYAFYNQYSIADPETYNEELPFLSAGYLNDNGSPLTTGDCEDRYALRSPARDAACSVLEIAYQGEPSISVTSNNTSQRDVIDGPLFTNDDYILTCNSPWFQDAVYANPTGRADSGQVDVWRSAAQYGSNCSSQTPRFSYTAQPNGERLPSSEILMPAAQEYVDALKNVLSGYATQVAGPVNIVLRPAPGNDHLNGDPASWKTQYTTNGGATWNTVTNGLLLVTGPTANSTISGTYDGSLSVVFEGSVNINKNLCVPFNPSNPSDQTCFDWKSATPAEKAARSNIALALTAGDKLNIEQLPTASNGEFGYPQGDTDKTSTNGNLTRHIDALLISMSGSVTVPGWSTAKWNPENAPTLEFNGLIASKYQGIFGGYNSDTGKLVSGYRKDFSFDTRFSDGTVSPPFMPTPITGNWVRADFVETASQ